MSQRKFVFIILAIVVAGIGVDRLIARYAPVKPTVVPVEQINAPVINPELARDEGKPKAETSTTITEKIKALVKDTPNDVTRYGKASLQINGEVVRVMIAGNEKSWEQGLSGHPSLAKNEGMWFSFPNEDIRAFWMPNMNFPIDIIWVGEDKRVIGAAINAQPETDLSNPEIYKSPLPAKYVLEIPAGDAERLGIKVGTVIGVLGDSRSGNN